MCSAITVRFRSLVLLGASAQSSSRSNGFWVIGYRYSSGRCLSSSYGPIEDWIEECQTWY